MSSVFEKGDVVKLINSFDTHTGLNISQRAKGIINSSSFYVVCPDETLTIVDFRDNRTFINVLTRTGIIAEVVAEEFEKV